MKRAGVVLLADEPDAGACPPGVDARRFARAVAEDVVDLLTDLADVQPAIAHTAGRRADAEAIRWPGTELIELAAGASPLLASFDALADAGFAVAVALAADAPDVPGLILAKPFSALAGASPETVAVIPAAGGGLVALAARLPAPAWLVELAPDLQTSFEPLQAAAPRRSCVRAGPVWHRLREPADLARLDPELAGWEATRALLSGG